jgi:hypothetical protein
MIFFPARKAADERCEMVSEVCLCWPTKLILEWKKEKHKHKTQISVCVSQPQNSFWDCSNEQISLDLNEIKSVP